MTRKEVRDGEGWLCDGASGRREGVFGVSFKVYGKGVAIGSDFDGVHGQ